MDLASSEEDYNQTDISTPVTDIPHRIEGLARSVIIPCVVFTCILIAVPPSLAIAYRVRKRTNGVSVLGRFYFLSRSSIVSPDSIELGKTEIKSFRSNDQRETGLNTGHVSLDTVCEFIDDASKEKPGGAASAGGAEQAQSCVKKAELWKQTMLDSHDYDQHAFSLPYFRAGIFDKHGGELHFKEAGVSLLIPPGAIQQTTPQLIYIYLHNDRNDSLLINSNMMATSPVVFCGPSGMKFNERVVLSYQHCANIKNNNMKLITLRTETEPDQPPSFHNITDDNDSMTLIKGNTVTLLLPHFTGHTSVLQWEQNEETLPIVQEKWLDLMLFSSEINEDDYDLQVRLYCANQTPDARHLVLEDERLLKGSMCSPTTPFLFAHASDLNVLLEADGDWTVYGGKMKQSIARKCLVENVRVPCVYRLEYDDKKTVTSLKCQVHVAQDGRESQGKIIDVLVRKQKSATDERRSGTLPHTRLVRRRLLLPYPLRESIRQKLDIYSTLGTDWRYLAYSLGYDDCIQQWEEQYRQRLIFSPTNELLNIWEARRSGDRTHDIDELIGIFEGMDRLDVISEIKTWNLIPSGRTK
ncbi:UNC5C-like protein isoform X1 [Anneissia japonica]|uniref:UNC5C-like protein isoform X1 n=1 Tax=Anneissia japonica TaxID=1529436 RepID=UPI0014254CCF|nr:UNC5C-like protein isoform X1 [Anneissia japonica]